MSAKTITKALAAMEDIAQGVGTANQTRDSGAVTVGLIDLPYAVSSVAAVKALDVTKFSRARLYSGNSYVDLYYDSGSTAGLSSDTGAGTWFVKDNTPTGASAEAQATALNGGVWETGISFTSRGQYMIYGNVAYVPKSDTALPYVSLATPDASKVKPITKAPIVVQTVDIAKASDVSVGDTIQTLEYSSGRGNGGCTYTVVAGGTGTEDGGKYHNCDNGLQLSANYDNVLDADTYGIDATGATDMQSKIMSMLSVIEATAGAIDTLLMPQGTVQINSAITYSWSVSYALEIKGKGEGCSINGNVSKTYKGWYCQNPSYKFTKMYFTGFTECLYDNSVDLDQVSFDNCDYGMKTNGVTGSGRRTINKLGWTASCTTAIELSTTGHYVHITNSFTLLIGTAPNQAFRNVLSTMVFENCWWGSDTNAAGATWTYFVGLEGVSCGMIFKKCLNYVDLGGSAWDEAIPLIEYAQVTTVAGQNLGSLVHIEDCDLKVHGGASDSAIMVVSGVTEYLPKMTKIVNTPIDDPANSKFIESTLDVALSAAQFYYQIDIDENSLGPFMDNSSYTGNDIVDLVFCLYMTKRLRSRLYAYRNGTTIYPETGETCFITNAAGTITLNTDVEMGELMIICNGSGTAQANVTMPAELAGNYAMGNEDTLYLKNIANTWYEISRSVNA